jgi:hypothetical protein
LKGSLHSFINIANIDMIDETYLNIGAFTVEHLKEVLFEVKGETTLFLDKPEFVLANMAPDLNNFILLEEPFFRQCLSNTLIYSFGQTKLRIAGKTTFDNVWLIDKYKEMEISTGDDQVPDYGLIAYLRNFVGAFLLGDQNEEPGGPQTLVFQNLVGYMNDMNI